MKPVAEDLELLQAIGEMKAKVKANPTGRIFLEVGTLHGVVVYHRMKADRMTEDEWARMQREVPCPREARVEAKRQRRGR
jgi:hypothetical protein